MKYMALLCYVPLPWQGPSIMYQNPWAEMAQLVCEPIVSHNEPLLFVDFLIDFLRNLLQGQEVNAQLRYKFCKRAIVLIFAGKHSAVFSAVKAAFRLLLTACEEEGKDVLLQLNS